MHLCMFRALAVSALITILGGCGGPNNPFVLMDEKHLLKPASIVVISGSNRGEDTKLAEALTKELKERTTFRVLSQEDIMRAIPNYPMTIKRRNVGKDEIKPVWFEASEKNKLDSIQSRLRVDYLFIVWGANLSAYTRTGQGGSSTTSSIAIIGNMIEYPGTRSSRPRSLPMTSVTPSWPYFGQRVITSTRCWKTPPNRSRISL